MKNPFLPLLIIGLLLSTSFSLVVMSHEDRQGYSNCPFEVAGVADCVQIQNSIDFAASHLNALAKFLLAIPVNNFTSLVALSLLVIFTIFTFFNKYFGLFKLRPVLTRNRLYEPLVSLNKTLFTRWFALHENSPSFTGRRWQ
ncbi:MAG: hypothetical protein AAB374_01115 [Patescibacteria group bacterium]